MPRKSFLLRLPEEFLEELRGWAAQELRSVNGQVEYVLRRALREAGREPRPDRSDPARGSDRPATDPERPATDREQSETDSQQSEPEA